MCFIVYALQAFLNGNSFVMLLLPVGAVLSHFVCSTPATVEATANPKEMAPYSYKS